MKSLIQAICLGLMTALLGYAVGTSGNESLGLVVFFAAPLGTGFVVAQIVQKRALIIAAAIAIGFASAGVAMAMGWEGLVCCVLASPILATGFALGAWFGGTVRNKNNSDGKNNLLLLMFSLITFPMLLAAGRFAENSREPFIYEQTITTRITVPCSVAEAWNYIKEIEVLNGPKPLLLNMGLPVPTRCTLSKNGVGGERLCYFKNGGIIRQRVTRWEPNIKMAFDITDSTLKGKAWLHFIDASYEFYPAKGGTTVIRHTRIGSSLTPRFYWKPLEAIGVRAEHDYVLANLFRFASTESSKNSLSEDMVH